MNYVKLKGIPLSEDDIAGYINDLPQNPLFLGIKDFRLSFAGVQDKASVCIIDGKICLPESGVPTTHVLKPEIASIKGSIENEYLRLTVSKSIRIESPNVEIK